MLERWRIAVLSVLTTALVILIGMNWSSGETRLKHTIEPLYEVDSPAFRRSLNRLLGPSFTPGNRIEALHNGVEIFPAMLDAIRSAKHSINFEIYIYWKGEIGRTFTAELCKKAREGVAVHILVDWLGSADIDESYVEQMKDAGIQLQFYRPLKWYTLDRLNNRTHRRILVVDGRVGFTGGVGVADEWQGNADSPKHWRDSHFRVEGPVVGQMQGAFMLNWMKVSPDLLHGDEYFPPLGTEGEADAQMFSSSAGGDDESVRLMYLLAIASARKNIRIANAYFVPDDLAIDQLLAARKRGVAIEVIMPGPYNDQPMTRLASQARWEELLKAGVAIHTYQPTMFHNKVMIVDDIFVSVGSTNFDSRSFQLNDEANLNILDRAFAAQEISAFERDKARSKLITLEDWHQRPWYERTMEFPATWVRSQL
ncbi:MAG: phospholipase D-like domain-containing protein [Pseudobdellovibrionaceae bacterium]|nr:phospholipase D-like domain-containing protein [Pseudobdellovibrionaceae bacterium]